MTSNFSKGKRAAIKHGAKADRREARRTLQNAVAANFGCDFKLTATKKQMRAAARKLTDQLLAGKNPAFGVSTETAATPEPAEQQKGGE